MATSSYYLLYRFKIWLSNDICTTEEKVTLVGVDMNTLSQLLCFSVLLFTNVKLTKLSKHVWPYASKTLKRATRVQYLRFDLDDWESTPTYNKKVN